jgi:hypothetical protein
MMKIALGTRKLTHSLAVLGAILLTALHAVSAHAQTRRWVSHNGNDTNLCVLPSSACLSFSRAITEAQDGGEVACLDSGGFGPVVITVSITINCSGVLAAPKFDGTVVCNDSAITINAPGKVVSLRGLTITGFNQLGCMDDNGILIQAAIAVYIEDCLIENFAQKGILDTRTTGGTKLSIKNTIVRNNGSAGIVVAAAFRNSAVLDNVQSVGNVYGVAIATGNNVVINRSVMSENLVAGIEADPGAFVYADNTEISQNASYGIYALGTVGLANSDITFNVSSISGTTMSYGNNRMFQNGPGTAPTPVGATSTDFGQQ